MSDLYNYIEELGKERGFKNMTVLCKAAGVPRSTMSELNNGRSSDLSKPNAQKFAELLGVSLDNIYSKQKEKAPAEPGKDVSDEDIKAAFFNGADPSLSKEDRDAMWQDAQDYFRFKIAQRRKQQENGK